MNPLVTLLSTFGPLIAKEVNETELARVVFAQEVAKPFSDFFPAILADADKIFPDAEARAAIVGLITFFERQRGVVIPPPAA